MQADFYAHPKDPCAITGSAKLELLVLKWAVIEIFHNYLLGLWFQVYRDNNLLTYVQESKLGASQI